MTDLTEEAPSSLLDCGRSIETRDAFGITVCSIWGGFIDIDFDGLT